MLSSETDVSLEVPYNKRIMGVDLLLFKFGNKLEFVGDYRCHLQPAFTPILDPSFT